MQAHAARAGAALALECRELLRVDAVAYADHSLACTTACGNTTGDRGPVQIRQQGLLVGQRVGFAGIRLGAQTSELEETRDSSGDLADDTRDLLVVG